MSNVIALPIRPLQITLSITDPEVIYELEKRDDGVERDAFASQALRLGVLALRQANGSLDADVIRREGDKLVSSVASVLAERTSELSGTIAKTPELLEALGQRPRRGIEVLQHRLVRLNRMH